MQLALCVQADSGAIEDDGDPGVVVRTAPASLAFAQRLRRPQYASIVDTELTIVLLLRRRRNRTVSKIQELRVHRSMNFIKVRADNCRSIDDYQPRFVPSLTVTPRAILQELALELITETEDGLNDLAHGSAVVPLPEYLDSARQAEAGNFDLVTAAQEQNDALIEIHRDPALAEEFYDYNAWTSSRISAR